MCVWGGVNFANDKPKNLRRNAYNFVLVLDGYPDLSFAMCRVWKMERTVISART